MNSLIRKCGTCGETYGIVFDRKGESEMMECKCQRHVNFITDMIMFMVCTGIILAACHFILGRG